MKKFFKQLVSAGDGVSSKRVLSLYFALLFTVVVVVHLCGVMVAESIIWALVGLISAGFGFSAVEKFRKGNNNVPLQ